ncbi:Zinc finger C2HC domain-containing protein 1C [Mactra antiquata]
MEQNNSMQNGLSRIPRFSGNKNSMQFNNQQPLPGVGQKPSRLEQMQMEYQKNILKQKEEKLINMYEDQQKRALNKVNQNRGIVRDFFNERRQNSGSSLKSNTGPTMDQLYQRKKQEFQNGYQSGYSSGGSRQSSGSRYGNNYYKNNPEVINRTMGRDRAKPLAPIQPNGEHSGNPFAGRKPQMVRPRTYKDKTQNRNYGNEVAAPRSAPNGYSNENYDYDYDDSPPPNDKQLQHLQQKRKMLQNQRQSNKVIMAQRTQQNTRKTPQSNRLDNNFEYQTSEDDEGYDENDNNSEDKLSEDDMKRKQQELLAQIESQQRELDRLKHEREAAEIEEKKERERRKKVEEERRRRMIEEEKRRQKEEEEERMKQQWEEEKQQKMEFEKRRMREASRNSNHTNDTRNNSRYDHHSPTPPPQPRPSKTRKTVPNKPPQKKAPQEQPIVTGDHTALYEQAMNIEGAYEETGRMAPCRNCGRRFAEDRLAKHEKACKNATKKRKAMDPTKLRTKGTDMEQFVAHRQPTPPKAKKKKDWRAQHESFIQAIRYAKKAKAIEDSGGNLADLPPPPPTENPDYVQCPYCNRKFNETAAERHIPHCKNTASRPKPPPQRRR